MVKNLPADVGDAGSITGSGKSPGGRNGNLLQYSCLENPMDRSYNPWCHKERDMTVLWCKQNIHIFDFTRHCYVDLVNSESLSCVWLFEIPWTIQSGPSPRNLPNPGIKSRSPTSQEDSLPTEPQGKPKNTGVGSLLQLIFPTRNQQGSPALQVDSLSTELSGKPW